MPYNELVQTIQEFTNWDITKTKNFVDSIKMCTYLKNLKISEEIHKNEVQKSEYLCRFRVSQLPKRIFYRKELIIKNQSLYQ